MGKYLDLGVILFLAGLAVSLVGLSPPEYAGARICLILAALLLSARVVMWMKGSFRSRVALGAVAILIVWACFVGTWRWVGAREAAAQSAPSAGSGNAPIGRDNNGQVCTSGATCTFNASPALPFQPHSENAPASRSGPLTVRDAGECPRGYLVLDSNKFMFNGTAIRAPADAHICLVNNQMYNNGTGLDLQEPRK